MFFIFTPVVKSTAIYVCVLLIISVCLPKNLWTMPERETSLVRGERLYNRACAACHGINGDGQAVAANALDPRPRDFSTGVYKFRSTPSGELPLDEDLFRIIASGIPRTMMPAWGKLLSDRDIYDIVAYIKTFSKNFQKYDTPVPVAIPAEPDISDSTIAEGKYVYMLMDCHTCHGTDGDGNGRSSDRLQDSWGHSVRPLNFTIGDYKGGSDARSIYQTFLTGLNGTPMPSYSGALQYDSESIQDFTPYQHDYSNEEIDALKSYLRVQPNSSAMAAMSEDEMQKLENKRIWSLVHYVKSLSKPKNLFYRLFIEKTDLAD